MPYPYNLSYFSDANYQQPIPTDDKGGILYQRADGLGPGQSIRDIIYIKNDNEEVLTLAPWSSSDEFQILNYPKELQPGEAGAIEVLILMPKEKPKPIRANWGFRRLVG